jgi:hypothetical protein
VSESIRLVDEPLLDRGVWILAVAEPVSAMERTTEIAGDGYSAHSLAPS